ncbi:MAG TPA: cytidine deaminase [Acidimicrobiales bacterium]|nr:cytidine deaminase [Acidimicrobiales bacterium]
MTETWRIDWDALRAAATAAAGEAYAPYSALNVGAAALTDRGEIVRGCNVENASYGLTLCAECILVGNLHLSGGESIVAVACVSGDGDLLMPCGRCRQLLLEAGGPDLLVDGPSGAVAIRDLLPHAFSALDLPEGDG